MAECAAKKIYALELIDRELACLIIGQWEYRTASEFYQGKKHYRKSKVAKAIMIPKAVDLGAKVSLTSGKLQTIEVDYKLFCKSLQSNPSNPFHLVAAHRPSRRTCVKARELQNGFGERKYKIKEDNRWRSSYSDEDSSD